MNAVITLVEANGSGLAPPALRRRAVAAAVSGHVIEWYEFAVYGVAAVYVAAAIFPSGDPGTSLLLTWLGYSTAFLVRPVGGIVLAHFGDRYGRRHALFATVMLMSAATFMMGLVPGFEVAGIAAPVLFVALRVLQGCAAGGEMPSAVTYVMEHSQEIDRSRAASWLAAGTFSASLLGAVVATGLASTLPAEAMVSWGWRALFIAALPLSLIALFLRRRAPESPGFVGSENYGHISSEAPIVGAIRTQKSAVLGFIGLGTLFNVGLAAALPAYTSELVLRGMPASQTLMVICVTYASLIASILVFARVGDRIGRRRIMLIGLIGVSIMAVPMHLLGSTGLLPYAVLGSALFVIPLGVYATPLYRCLTDMFPARVRVTAGALAFNATAAFGGLIPAAVIWFRTALGFDHSLLLFLGVSALAAAAVLFVRKGLGVGAHE